jgi:hypothetical protein
MDIGAPAKACSPCTSVVLSFACSLGNFCSSLAESGAMLTSIVNPSSDNRGVSSMNPRMMSMPVASTVEPRTA